MYIKAELDGSVSALPGEFQYSADDPGSYRARTVIFIFPNVRPGPHTVQMRYRSLNGTQVEIGVHNMIVQFAHWLAAAHCGRGSSNRIAAQIGYFG
jgi:hypothetical protein